MLEQCYNIEVQFDFNVKEETLIIFYFRCLEFFFYGGSKCGEVYFGITGQKCLVRQRGI